MDLPNASEIDQPKSLNMPIRLPAELAEKLAAAATSTGLSKQDVARLAMDRGIDVLLRQLLDPPASPAA